MEDSLIVNPTEECERLNDCKCLKVKKFQFKWRPSNYHNSNGKGDNFQLLLYDQLTLPIWLRVDCFKEENEADVKNSQVDFSIFNLHSFVFGYFENKMPKTVIKIAWKVGPWSNLLGEDKFNTVEFASGNLQKNPDVQIFRKCGNENFIEIKHKSRTGSLKKPQDVKFEIYFKTDRKLIPYHKDFEQLRTNGFFTDVKLVCDGAEFPCHCVVLVAMSPVFHEMLCGKFQDSINKTINIEDFTKEELKDVIKFMYTLKEDAIHIHAPRLLAFAKKYDMQILRTACENYLIETLTSNNVAFMLTLATESDLKTFKTRVLQKIKSNWCIFKKNMSLQKILESDIHTTIKLIYAFE